MRKYFAEACRILDRIFSEGTYSDRAFGASSADMTERLVLGVLEQNVKIEYILGGLIVKQPQKFIYVLLKTGVYALLNLDNVPDYAIVSECVETAKEAGKTGAAGFVNAVLKKVARREFVLPDKNSPDYLSVTYSKPKWFVDRLIAEYGESRAMQVLENPVSECVHARVNNRLTTAEAVKGILSAQAIDFRQSAVGGLILRPDNNIVKSLFSEGVLTYQSPSSVLAVQALAPRDGGEMLDLCSAPGGKAVYMAELCPHSVVTACDIHAHRVELIRKYAGRMHVDNVCPVKADASKFNPEWRGRFDYILLDAPCTCFGTFRRHPDVFLQRGEEEIGRLSVIQKKMISTAAQYLKTGGKLLYSTCTLFAPENGEIADYAERAAGLVPETMPIPYSNNGRYQLLPLDEWDGFFMARFTK